ncbi:MAG: serine/threonine protein kinase, partial [Myxococcales bacterium]|nr:serine/threonine protein kinase [Myxococcales bacterium]
LAHPNIITVFDFDRDGRVAYMTMELLDGSSLSGLMHRKGSSLDWKDAEPIIRGVGAALAYAHEQGIVHADIKPGNIFLTTDGRVKLLDFGIAQAIREGVAAAGAAAGNGLEGALTPGFASVEMLEGMPAAPKDDIYAFACVIYEMLAGHHPFDGKTASEAEANGDKPA